MASIVLVSTLKRSALQHTQFLFSQDRTSKRIHFETPLERIVPRSKHHPKKSLSCPCTLQRPAGYPSGTNCLSRVNNCNKYCRKRICPCYGATRNRLRTRRPGPPRAVSYATRLKQKKPSPPIGMGRPVFHEAKRKVLIAPTPKARPGESLRSGRRCRGEGIRDRPARGCSPGRKILGSRLF